MRLWAVLGAYPTSKSRGIFFKKGHLPPCGVERDRLILAALGSPDCCRRLGSGDPHRKTRIKMCILAHRKENNMVWNMMGTCIIISCLEHSRNIPWNHVIHLNPYHLLSCLGPRLPGSLWTAAQWCWWGYLFDKQGLADVARRISPRGPLSFGSFVNGR